MNSIAHLICLWAFSEQKQFYLLRIGLFPFFSNSSLPPIVTHLFFSIDLFGRYLKLFERRGINCLLAEAIGPYTFEDSPCPTKVSLCSSLLLRLA